MPSFLTKGFNIGALIILTSAFKVIFVDFKEEDIISDPFMFRFIQMTLSIFLLSIGYLVRHKMNITNDFDIAFLILSIFSGFTFFVLSTIMMFGENFEAARKSVAFTNICLYFIIPQKGLALGIIFSEALENLKVLLENM